MAAARRFPARLLRALDESKYLWIRAGDEHRLIGIWVVVADGRAFVSNLKYVRGLSRGRRRASTTELMPG